MVSTVAWNARDVGSIPALGTIFPIFITPTTYAFTLSRITTRELDLYVSFKGDISQQGDSIHAVYSNSYGTGLRNAKSVGSNPALDIMFSLFASASRQVIYTE